MNRPTRGLSTLKSPHLDLHALNVDLHIEQTRECAAPGDLLKAKEAHFYRHIRHVVVAHRPQLFRHAALRQVGVLAALPAIC